MIKSVIISSPTITFFQHSSNFSNWTWTQFSSASEYGKVIGAVVGDTSADDVDWGEQFEPRSLPFLTGVISVISACSISLGFHQMTF